MDPQKLEVFGKAFEIIVLGMGTVITALSFFAVIIWLLTAIDEKLNAYKIKKYAKQVVTKEGSDELNDEIIAVISAAVFIAINKPVKIHKMRFLDNSKGNSWASSGRNTLMSSHFIKRS